jgi:hypothetical protein
MATYIELMTDVLVEALGLKRDVLEPGLRAEMIAGGVIDLDEQVPDDKVLAIKQALLADPSVIIDPVKRGFEQARSAYVHKAVEQNKRLSFKHARGRKKR